MSRKIKKVFEYVSDSVEMMTKKCEGERTASFPLGVLHAKCRMRYSRSDFRTGAICYKFYLGFTSTTKETPTNVINITRTQQRLSMNVNPNHIG